jgi:hypothetical protein
MIDTSALIVAAGALATAIGTAVKQITDNKELRKWICTKNPCEGRTQVDPTPTIKN